MTGETGERLRWAAEVAARVGGLLIERFRHTVAAERKARGIVTDLDREADRLIADALEESFPQDGLLSEEGAFHGGASGWRWIVDPLDGTTNYVSGLPHFGVSLACLDPEGVALGLVHAPAFGETFSAVRGEGSQGPDGPLRPTGTSDLSDAVFLLNKAYHPAAELWERSERLLERIRAHRMLGCVSLDLAFVAAGRGDGIILLEAEPWDIAAGVLLMAEAGIRVANLDGGPPPPDRPTGIFAASPTIYEQALPLLGPFSFKGGRTF